MSNSTGMSAERLLRLTAELVAVYVGKNNLAANQLPETISAIHQSLGSLSNGRAEAELSPPAVPIKKSVTSDYLICLEDGKKQKALKRHLRTAHNLSPGDYRKRWGLPGDYPMVAPSYAAVRSAISKKIGFGRRMAAKTRRQPAAAAQRPVKPTVANGRRRRRR
jgi:predicted transcriptional regulator